MEFNWSCMPAVHKTKEKKKKKKAAFSLSCFLSLHLCSCHVRTFAIFLSLSLCLSSLSLSPSLHLVSTVGMFGCGYEYVPYMQYVHVHPMMRNNRHMHTCRHKGRTNFTHLRVPTALGLHMSHKADRQVHPRTTHL